MSRDRFSRRDFARYTAALAVAGCGGGPATARAASPPAHASRWYDDAIVIAATRRRA